MTRRSAGADFSPDLDLTYSEARLDGYTETGGGFPARFDRRKDKATELRAGVGVEGKLAGGGASLMLNATTRGSAPSHWLAANWQRAF